MTDIRGIQEPINYLNPTTADGTFLRLDATNDPLTGSLTGPNFISTVAIGTQPYAATSTTLNTNLNADLLDGNHLSDITTTYDERYLLLDQTTPQSWANDWHVNSAQESARNTAVTDTNTLFELNEE